MIRVRVLYFGMARDAAGKGEESFTFSRPASVEALISEAEGRHPGLARLRQAMRFAVNEEIAEGNIRLRDGDRVAVLPPVAGG